MRAAALALALLPAGASAEGALERLRALAAPAPPAAADIYAEEIAADRALLAAEAGALFDSARPGLGPADAPVAIALFTGPGCAACAPATAELEELATRLGVRAVLIDTGADPADAALMRRLGLDLLPSYALPWGMIRGAMPAVVLERYLAP